MSEATPASYGAIDLSQSPNAGDGSGIPLIDNVSEANFEAQMELSATVPVILAFVSSKSLVSKQALAELEAVTRERRGAIALRVVDIDADPGIAQALQIQSLPTAIALVARRPVPLFEGAPTKQQLNSLIDQLLEAAAQLGVSGTLPVAAEELETPEPASHQAPRAAEDAGDWEQAIGLWKKVLANDPGDKEAKIALARAEFEARVTANEPEVDSPLAQADALFSAGQEAAAFDVLLAVVGDPSSPEEKDAARERLVELFQLAIDSDAVKSARSRLTALLF